MAAQGIEDGAQSFAFGVSRPGGSGGMLPQENFEILTSGIPEYLYIYIYSHCQNFSLSITYIPKHINIDHVINTEYSNLS